VVNGYEILSEWKINGNEYYNAYNVLLTVEGDLYCKLSGIAAAIDAPTYLPEFRKIALSFTRQAP